jgi:DNA (cytosine-5)-methyltransferase 1
MNTDLSSHNPSEDALTQQRKSTTSTEIKQITDCPICYYFPKPNITGNTELKLKLLERKCPVCGKNCGKPALLDLFSGAGGAARGYQKAGFCVLGIDIKPQPHYAGCRFHQADALTYPLDGFDAYHASPPCQKFSQSVSKENRLHHYDYIEIVRGRLKLTGKLFVIENVPLAPLTSAFDMFRNYGVMLCGSMFNLPLRRHRKFETNIKIAQPDCQHSIFKPIYPCAFNRKNPLRVLSISGGFQKDISLEVYKNGFGIYWEINRRELSEAIPPAYTEYIGKYLMQAVLL